MDEPTGGEAFALRGGNRALLEAGALIVARVETQRVPYTDIRDAFAAEPEPGEPGCDVLCPTERGPLVLSCPDRATRERYLAALRARMRQAQRADA